MASYTKIVNRYCGGDAIWTNQSNASTIIIADFFGVSNDPEPPIDGNATVTPANITLSSNAIVAKGSANSVVALANLTIQSNSVVVKGSSNVIVSNSSLVVNADSVIAIGNAIANTSNSNISFTSNNITAIGSANAFVTQLNSLLSANGISAKGSGTALIETSNITFTALDFVIVAPIIDVVANVNTANITIKLNNVIAYQLDVSKNEVLLCVSIVINKIEFNSQIKNEIIWESYISNKLILQSHY
jgi:hypothetical protein